MFNGLGSSGSSNSNNNNNNNNNNNDNSRQKNKDWNNFVNQLNRALINMNMNDERNNEDQEQNNGQIHDEVNDAHNPEDIENKAADGDVEPIAEQIAEQIVEPIAAPIAQPVIMPVQVPAPIAAPIAQPFAPAVIMPVHAPAPIAAPIAQPFAPAVIMPVHAPAPIAAPIAQQVIVPVPVPINNPAIANLDVSLEQMEQEHDPEYIPGPSPRNNAPNPPMKRKAEDIGWIRKLNQGLPLPFEPRQPARRVLLFDEPGSPLPNIRQCPPRKPSSRCASRLDGNRDGVARRRLDFDNDDQEEEMESVENSPPVGAQNQEDDSILFVPSAPKKKKMACEPEVVVAQDIAMEEVEPAEEEVQPEEAGPSRPIVLECPSPPHNSPSMPEDADVSFEFANIDGRWARISTPASAPLPNMRDTPSSSARKTRRKSDVPLRQASRKRLLFN